MTRKAAKWLWATLAAVATIGGAIGFVQILLHPLWQKRAATERFHSELENAQILNGKDFNTLRPLGLIDDWRVLIGETLQLESLPAFLSETEWPETHQQHRELAARISDRIASIEAVIRAPMACVRLNDCVINSEAQYCHQLSQLIDDFQNFNYRIGNNAVVQANRLALRRDVALFWEECGLGRPEGGVLAPFILRMLDRASGYDLVLQNSIVASIGMNLEFLGNDVDFHALRMTHDVEIADLQNRFDTYCGSILRYFESREIRNDLGVSGGEFLCFERNGSLFCHTHTNSGQRLWRVEQLFSLFSEERPRRNEMPLFSRCRSEIPVVSRIQGEVPQYFSETFGICETDGAYNLESGQIYFYNCSNFAVFRADRNQR